MRCRFYLIALTVLMAMFGGVHEFVSFAADEFYVIPAGPGRLDDRYVNVTGDTMTGDLTANAFLYNSDQNTYLSVPGLAFLPDRETLVYLRGIENPGPGLQSQDASLVKYVAPVYLPHGAKIWNMMVWFYRTSCTSTSSHMRLYETEISTGTALTYTTSPLLQISTTLCTPVNAQPGPIIPLAGVVDNELKTYFLEAMVQGGGGPDANYTTIRWVRIDYSVDTPLP